MNQITTSQKIATQRAIKSMAWHTAQGSGKRAEDAQKHCNALGIDWTKSLVSTAP